LCKVCEYTEAADKAEARARQSDALLQEAMRQAQTEAYQALEHQTKELERKSADCQNELRDLTARRDALAMENAAAQSKLTTAISRTEKLKYLAQSINAALEATTRGESVPEIKDLEELLPENDLNCLTVKTLAAKYRETRKQIIAVCKAYESNYETKTIRALYRLMVLGLEAELENVLYTLRFGTLDKAIADIRTLTSKYYTIAIDGNQTIAPTLRRFIAQIESLYLKTVDIEYEYYVKREQAKEEQRAIKEQMRQEAEERKQLEAEKKRVEAEEKKYQQEIDRIVAEMNKAHGEELAALQRRLDEMNGLMSKVEEKKAEIVNLQNGKAGTVYIISNIGAFGDNVFKIGMTRRLEPQERVDELGSASVPFPFDVHSFIFSDDAVELENDLHKELDSRRVNKINRRKEFFNVDVGELREIVERIDPTASFRETALAEQYRQSVSMARERMDDKFEEEQA
jgi:hypothetical protein